MVRRIIGVDPGSRVTGFGCIEARGNQLTWISHGCIRLKEADFPTRLHQLSIELDEILKRDCPDTVVIEKAFFAKNAASALKLGQVRGVIMLCAARLGLQVAEYTPAEIKRSVVGNGQADKHQVARVVEMIFPARKRTAFQTHDASDGLAMAICHANQSRVQARV